MRVRHPQLRKMGFIDKPNDMAFICHELEMVHQNGKSTLRYTFYGDSWTSYITYHGCHHQLFASGHTEPEAVTSAKFWLKKF